MYRQSTFLIVDRGAEDSNISTLLTPAKLFSQRAAVVAVPPADPWLDRRWTGNNARLPCVTETVAEWW